MDAQLAKRIAAALENTPDDTITAYRSALQASDPTDCNSLTSVPIFHCQERRSVAISCRFSQPTAVVTLIVWRGYTTETSTTGTFVAQGKETYSFTAPSSGGPTIDGKFSPDEALFSHVAARALKISVPSSVSTGTVEIWARRIS